MRNTPPLAILFLVSIVLATTVACGPGSEHRTHADDTAEAEVSAEVISMAFERDEVAAARLYAGKRIRLSGYVSNIERRPDGVVSMTLKTSPSTFRPVRCVMNAEETLDRVEPDSPVTISGRVSGFVESTYYVLLEDCRKL
jgi:hypothetical protein